VATVSAPPARAAAPITGDDPDAVTGLPAEVVHAIFYNFADGEVCRHIPRVWDTVTPEAALADELAAPAYSSLEPGELDQLVADLEPISAALDAAGSR
jgi:hypothetical protein